MPATILVVDDERALVSTISYNLRSDGHSVLTASDGAEALELVKRHRPDLVILDLMLPGMQGLDVCREIRESPQAPIRAIPILMLTARAGEVDKVVGLRVGADDYVTKPFSMHELMARVHAMLRRAQLDQTRNIGAEDQPFTRGDFEVDPASRRICVQGSELVLTPKEFDLLVLLLRNPGRVFTRNQLLDQVWEHHYIGDIRTIDVHVRWLRSKIEADPAHPRLIETVRGVGYRLRMSD